MKQNNEHIRQQKISARMPKGINKTLLQGISDFNSEFRSSCSLHNCYIFAINLNPDKGNIPINRKCNS